MKAATVQQIKSELTERHPSQLLEIALRLAKFKKENKELLSYLLFYDNDEAGFVDDIKKEIDDNFSGINKSHLYYAKKSLRKILRIINKFVRYSPKTETEIELRMHFVKALRKSGISMRSDKQIIKIYEGQVSKISKAIGTLHEDLQYEYLKVLPEL